ncbi:hypothetical protein [Galactobacter sp.]|uniref:hypothetical protein n=1 Tax=Galactobacter sp. TaxID=2676125 RepID=UPI0025BC50F1|nr:hypothetical protein [Galactobacter sp.]
MKQLEYAVAMVTVDGRPVPVGQWSGVYLPERPAAGGLIMPEGVANNPRFRILSIEADTWHTEDSGVRTLEFCSPAEQAIRDLAINCLTGKLVVRRHGPNVTISKGSTVISLAPPKPRLLYA